MKKILTIAVVLVVLFIFNISSIFYGAFTGIYKNFEKHTTERFYDLVMFTYENGCVLHGNGLAPAFISVNSNGCWEYVSEYDLFNKRQIVEISQMTGEFPKEEKKTLPIRFREMILEEPFRIKLYGTTVHRPKA